jgi:hypothetical protein
LVCSLNTLTRPNFLPLCLMGNQISSLHSVLQDVNSVFTESRRAPILGHDFSLPISAMQISITTVRITGPPLDGRGFVIPHSLLCFAVALAISLYISNPKHKFLKSKCLMFLREFLLKKFLLSVFFFFFFLYRLS